MDLHQQARLANIVAMSSKKSGLARDILKLDRLRPHQARSHFNKIAACLITASVTGRDAVRTVRVRFGPDSEVCTKQRAPAFDRIWPQKMDSLLIICIA